ncbi:hypothetical protein ACA910_010996 [Epithemia clementina (nom. ined.)]
MLKCGHLKPGDCVSMDQYQTPIPGHLPNTYGKELKSEQYNGGTLFVDHASRVIFNVHQVSLRVGKTMQALQRFECFAKEYGVAIQTYHANNAPFGHDEFVSELEERNKKIKFSGVGAHHQNGVSERAIQTVTRWARAMKLHATIHWPELSHLNLCPFALNQAIYLWNNLPNRVTGVAPLEYFGGQHFPSFDHLRRTRVWGVPCTCWIPRCKMERKFRSGRRAPVEVNILARPSTTHPRLDES